MRIRIDRSLCAGHGRCFSLAPEVFDYDEEGFRVLREETIPPGLEDAARRGAAGCPERAVVVEEGLSGLPARAQ
jgi:ferredoxin